MVPIAHNTAAPPEITTRPKCSTLIKLQYSLLVLNLELQIPLSDGVIDLFRVTSAFWFVKFIDAPKEIFTDIFSARS
jgi:hypothetical protein